MFILKIFVLGCIILLIIVDVIRFVLAQIESWSHRFLSLIINAIFLPGKNLFASLSHIFINNIKRFSPVVTISKKNISENSQRKFLPVKKLIRNNQNRTNVRFRGKIIAFLIGVVFSFIFVFIPLLFYFLAHYLPHPTQLSLNKLPQTTKIYDRNKKLLYEIYSSQNRTIVSLAEIPKNLQQATIAIEDKNFYTNPGFDIIAMMRAFLSNASGNHLQGGSTITQQLVKSSLLSSERTIRRKIEEIILSFWTEQIYTKNKILELYFNTVPYGGTAWGVEAAAQLYFGKEVNELNLAESAFLAGLPKAPSVYSPYSDNPNAWKARQKEVLERMRILGYITPQQMKDAERIYLKFRKPVHPILAPHFVMYVRDLLIQKYGLVMVEKGGLEVITSLDLSKQEKTQTIISDEIENNNYMQIGNGAAVITNPQNGDIITMVGSKDYFDSALGSFNVTTALRQPGSSIKVVTYTQALAKGFTAASLIEDSPKTFSATGSAAYSPVNYDGKFHGNIPLRIALANSFNIPAVKLLESIGLSSFLHMAKNMGIESLKTAENYGLSLTLGGGEVTMLDMTRAYGTLANQGKSVELNPILSIRDSRGEIIEEKEVRQYEAINPGIAFIITDILSDDTARSWAFGRNSLLHIPGKHVAVKTGTTDEKKDNWTIGFTKDYVVTVWVGNNDNTPMSPQLTSGLTGAAPIWHSIMEELLKNTEDKLYTPPANVISISCNGKTEYFIKGTEQNAPCNREKQQSPIRSFFSEINQRLKPFRGRRRE